MACSQTVPSFYCTEPNEIIISGGRNLLCKRTLINNLQSVCETNVSLFYSNVYIVRSSFLTKLFHAFREKYF